MNAFTTSAVLAAIAAVLIAWAVSAARSENKPSAVSAEKAVPAEKSAPAEKAAPAEPGDAATKTKDWDGKKIVRTNAEWGKRLTKLQFRVTRKKGTEPAFQNKYWKYKRDGTYRCVGCGLPLFHSSAKYASGTGWPSFWQPAEKTRVEYEKDVRLFEVRTEVKCARCDAHLGHVFRDGPHPTGLRYCMNSAALDFQAKTAATKKPPGKKKGR